MPSIRISNKVIGDPGENIFSEVVGGGNREQQEEDQVGCQDMEADKPSTDKFHPLCINKVTGSWILAVWIQLGD